MARTIPRSHHKTIATNRRFDFLRSQLQAGRPEVCDLRIRRQRFDSYRLVNLPPVDTQVCYNSPEHRAEHWHHIIPISRGGDDHPKNLVPLCQRCHKRVHRHGDNRNKRQEPTDTHFCVLTKPALGIVYVPPMLMEKPPQ